MDSSTDANFTLSGEEDEFDQVLFQQLYAQGLKDSSNISKSLPIPKFYSKVGICDYSHSLEAFFSNIFLFYRSLIARTFSV